MERETVDKGGLQYLVRSLIQIKAPAMKSSHDVDLERLDFYYKLYFHSKEQTQKGNAF